MKTIRLIPLLALLILGSCSSISVATDYDSTVNFAQFKTYAFLKEGIDDLKISDLDKKRILNAIDQEMTAKGYTKSEHPDLVINLFTDSKQNVHVNSFYGGWGWNPWMWGPGYQSVSTSTEGILYIDILKASNRELIWQGKGTGYLNNNSKKREERIKEFTKKVLADFPQKI